MGENINRFQGFRYAVAARIPSQNGTAPALCTVRIGGIKLKKATDTNKTRATEIQGGDRKQKASVANEQQIFIALFL